MANGPFGNPLSTGIALSFEVDMTPYREMHKRKLLAAKEKEEDQKKKQQQYADILKNITPPDASKIHKKYMPEVQNQYAELIDSAMGYINRNDMASMYKHMFEFNANADKAVQATQNYKSYVDSDANKTFKSLEAIRAMEDNDTPISQIAKDYQNDVEFGDGFLHWATIERPDVIGEANKVLQGTEKIFMTDDAGNYVRTGKVGPRKEELYRKSIKDPDKFFESQANLLKNSVGGNRLIMEYGGITAAQLDDRQPDGRQLRDVLADKYVRELLSPKVYGEEGIEPYRPYKTTAPTSGAGFIGKIGLTQSDQGETISSTSTDVKSLKSDLTSLVGAISKLSESEFNDMHSDNINLDNSNVRFINVADNPLDNEDYVRFEYNGKEFKFDINNKQSIKDALNSLIEEGITDEEFKNLATGLGVNVPSKTDQLLSFKNSLKIQAIGTSDIAKKFTLPSGDDIIVKGTSGAKRMKISNKIPFERANIENVSVDDSGNLWATINYPVKEDDNILRQLFGSDDNVEQFVKSNGLPSTFIVPYTDDIRSTIISLDKNMTGEAWDARVAEMTGAAKSGTSSSSPSNSGGTINLQDIPTGAKIEQKNGKNYYNGKEVIM